MNELRQCFSEMLGNGILRMILSKPEKNGEYKKIVIEQKSGYYQIAKYTEKQVFHENIDREDTKELTDRCAALAEGRFRQVNGFGSEYEYQLLISKKQKCTLKKRKHILDESYSSHNRKKQYLLQDGVEIPPLVDMGVFTKDGKVVNAMYDKYRQINRFLEIIDDEVSGLNAEELNVIDFGCGKSYLTFVVYYYLTRIRNLRVRMIGLDLKEEVIRKCNEAAEKYGYEGLTFELGDINGFKAPFEVDMVLTLHACDTATDYALYNAIQWKAKMIFCVPCCQHELNGQMSPQNLGILSKYGIVKERFSALATDAIRGNLLEYSGYKTQLLEFIDFEHTPKNILLRAVRRPITPKGVSQKAVSEVESLMQEFGFQPKLWELLGPDMKI